MPLVAVHGAFTSGLSFSPLLDRPPAGCRVIAPDLPGHGISPVSAEPFRTWADLSERIVALIEAMHLSDVCLIGHSMGGGICAVTAAASQNRIRGLVLLNSATLPFSLPFKGRIPLLPVVGELVFYHIYGERMFFKFFRDDVFFDTSKIDPECISAYFRGFNRNRTAALQAIRITSNPRFVEACLPDIACPTLVAWGRNDSLIPLFVAEQTARRIPNASLAFIDACGHAPLEEQPEQTLNIITAFWEETLVNAASDSSSSGAEQRGPGLPNLSQE